MLLCSLARIEPCVTITDRNLGGFPSSPHASLTSSPSVCALDPNHFSPTADGLPAEAPTFHSVVTREALLALVAWQDITEMAIAFCSLTAMEGGCGALCCSRWIFDLGIRMCACLLNLLQEEVGKRRSLHLTLGLNVRKVF